MLFLSPLVLFGHLGALVFLAFFIFFEYRSVPLKWFALCFIILLASIIYPYVVGDSGLAGSGSGIRARSGLDGSMERMQNHFQALFLPDWHGSSVSLMRWAPLVICGLLVSTGCALLNRPQVYDALKKFTKVFLIGIIGYLPDLIMFPQSVSVHPWLYDFGWIMPLYIATHFFLLNAVTSANVKVSSLKLFYIGVVTVFILMFQLRHIILLG